MKEKYITSLKALLHDEEALKKKLSHLLRKDKLKVSDLKKAQDVKPPFKIPPSILNSIGICFRQGKDDFEQDEEKAVALYELADGQGDAAGCYNLAFCAVYGFGKVT